jgi:anti-anti-sigma factor
MFNVLSVASLCESGRAERNVLSVASLCESGRAERNVQCSKFNVQSYMYLEIKENEGVLTGILSGHIDTLASEELGREMAPLLESADRQIVLDCENLAYISSSGLRLLLTLRKKVAADGGSLVIRNINDEIRKVFTLTGFFKLFDIRN